MTFTAETWTYISVVVLASGLALFYARPVYDLHRLLVFLSVGFCLALTVRDAGFDADIRQYALAMHTDGYGFYFLREPIVWLGMRYLYDVLNSEVAVLLTFDLIGLAIAYAAFAKLKAPWYALFGFLCFFPFVLGMQNIYRQWLSALFLLLAYSVARSGSWWRYLFAIVASLTHNVAFLFWPLLFSSSRTRSARAFFWIGILLVPVAIEIGLETKSSAATGANLAWAYLGLLVLLLVAHYAMRLLPLRTRSVVPDSRLLLASLIIVGAGVGSLSSASAERVGMFALMICYPLIAVRLEQLPIARLPARLAFIHFGFWPIFFFGTAGFLIDS